MRTDSIAEKVVIVTGASSGIGRAAALRLARAGATVVLASRNEATLTTLESEIRALDGRAWSVPTDVTDQDQIHRLVHTTLERCGRIDIVVCNAGVIVRKPIVKTVVDDYERIMAVNFYGAVRLILAVLPHMLERRSGHVVVVSSVDGKKGLPPEGVYVASKCAITGFMDVLRQELRGTGVVATTVLPGRVDTPMIENLEVPLLSAKIPSDRVGRAVLRAIRRKRAELVVPFAGPKLLILASSMWAPLGDWFVRTLDLEGVETTA